MRPLLPTLLLLAAGPVVAQYHGGGGGGRNRDTQTTTDQSAPPDQRPAGSERATIYVEPVGMMIAAWDTDGDGKTSRAELTAGVERSFRAIDTGGSGRLGYIEFADWAERFLGDRNALPSPFAVDRNGDNIITLMELQTAIAHEFDRFDANHDGTVTRAELLTIRDVPAGGGERRKGGQRGGGGGGRGGGRGGRGGGGGDPTGG